MHERFRTCNSQSRTFPLPHGDPAYVDLEVFLSVLANGYPISVPVERP
jgi:sulfur-oxidizing protein SoxA